MTRPTILTAASSVSAVGMAMSVASALDRAATPADQAMTAAIGIVITGAAHVLPGLTRSAAGRALWVACMAAAIYGHAGYVSSAVSRAGVERAAHVQHDTAADALREQLQHIASRPTATVAAALGAAQRADAAAATAASTCRMPCDTLRGRARAASARVAELQTELDEARRADALREQLTHQAERHDARRQSAQADPAATAIASLTGLPAERVQTGAAMLCASLVELVAAMLWSLTLQPIDPTSARQAANPARSQQTTPAASTSSALGWLRTAVSALIGATPQPRARDRPTLIEPDAPWPRRAAR